MSKCPSDDFMDSYLLGRINSETTAEFEKHYFECTSCFARMAERDEVIKHLRKEEAFGATAGYKVEDLRQGSALGRVFASLTPRRWAVIGATAMVIILAVWLLVPKTGTGVPTSVLTGDQRVHGAAVALVSPAGDIALPPAFFEWKPLGESLEFKVTLSDGAVLWSASTKDSKIQAPADLLGRMKAGETYAWQVRAFKPDGTLVAVSEKVRFRIVPNQ